MKITHSAKIMKPLLMLNTMVYVTTNTGIYQNIDRNRDATNGLYKKCVSLLCDYPSLGSEQKESIGLCFLEGKLIAISSLNTSSSSLEFEKKFLNRDDCEGGIRV
jgi:hypothetical protein